MRLPSGLIATQFTGHKTGNLGLDLHPKRRMSADRRARSTETDGQLEIRFRGDSDHLKTVFSLTCSSGGFRLWLPRGELLNLSAALYLAIGQKAAKEQRKANRAKD
jgi:hypothetical protein